MAMFGKQTYKLIRVMVAAGLFTNNIEPVTIIKKSRIEK